MTLIIILMCESIIIGFLGFGIQHWLPNGTSRWETWAMMGIGVFGTVAAFALEDWHNRWRENRGLTRRR